MRTKNDQKILPDEIKALFIKRVKEQEYDDSIIVNLSNRDVIAYEVMHLLAWHDTIEGPYFWDRISKGDFSVYYKKYDVAATKSTNMWLDGKTLTWGDIEVGDLIEICRIEGDVKGNLVYCGCTGGKLCDADHIVDHIVDIKELHIASRVKRLSIKTENGYGFSILRHKYGEIQRTNFKILKQNKQKTNDNKKEHKTRIVQVSKIIAKVRKGTVPGGRTVSCRILQTAIESRPIKHRTISVK